MASFTPNYWVHMDNNGYGKKSHIPQLGWVILKQFMGNMIMYLCGGSMCMVALGVGGCWPVNIAWPIYLGQQQKGESLAPFPLSPCCLKLMMITTRFQLTPPTDYSPLLPNLKLPQACVVYDKDFLSISSPLYKNRELHPLHLFFPNQPSHN